MRALAHPARMAIWQFLGLEGPATATECAEIAGLSPSACSYHLRTLARYGIVEEDPASSTDGRQRPWRVKVIAITVDDGAHTTPAMREAGRLFAASAFAPAEELRESYRDRESEYPADWRTALGTTYDVLHATPEELLMLQRRLLDLFGEYRRLSRDERPPGAGRVQVTVDLTPWFPPPAQQKTRPSRSKPGPFGRLDFCPPALPPFLLPASPTERSMTTTEAPSRPPSLTTAWRSGPLGVPAFRRLTIGQFTSTIGDYCYAVALPWLVLSGGGSAASLGIVLACYGIPRALLTLAGGSLADRFGPRLVMIASDGARCGLTAVFAVLAAEHVSSLAAVAPVAAALGACSALFMPASMTIMPALIEESRLTSANALYTGVVQLGSLLGPVLGGVLVAATGPTPAFAVDAGSFLVSAASVALIRGVGGRAAGARASAAVAAPAGCGRGGGRQPLGAAAAVADPADHPGRLGHRQLRDRGDDRGGAARAGARALRCRRLRRGPGLLRGDQHRRRAAGRPDRRAAAARRC